MRWTLREHGDFDEQHFGHYLASSLPNYEEFWATFIVPLTKRPQAITFRPDVDPLLQRMAEAHYSVFWHLVAAHRLIKMAEKPPGKMALLFDSILFHMSVATEMVEDFLFIWAQIESRFENRRLSGVSPLSVDEAVAKVKKFVDSSTYQKALGRFRERGRPISIPLHTEQDVFGSFLKSANAQAAYESFRITYQRVRHYRNVVAHNPILGKLMWVGDPSSLLIPREDKLHQYDEWWKVFQSPPRGDFVEAAELAATFLRQVEETINGLWQHIIPYCEELAGRPGYECLMGKGSRFEAREMST